MTPGFTVFSGCLTEENGMSDVNDGARAGQPLSKNPPPDPDAIIFCRKCGEKNKENNRRCTRCGDGLHGPSQFVAAGDDNAALRMLLPVDRSFWAIASGYLGLLSVLLFPAPLAVITGLMAVRDIRKHPGKLGMGRAVFGIVLGVLGTLGLTATLISMAFNKQ
jgi:hypothetical protein